MDGSALFDSTGTYRYRLTRHWGDDLFNRPRTMCFIMLNPSTADHQKDDPTIRRCIGIARAWGFDSLVVVNLFAARATDRKVLASMADPIGPDNDRHILQAAVGNYIVAAWGAHPWDTRTQAMLRLLRGHSLHCLGRTKEGQPRHPLYVRSDALASWDPTRQTQETPRTQSTR